MIQRVFEHGRQAIREALRSSHRPHQQVGIKQQPQPSSRRCGLVIKGGDTHHRPAGFADHEGLTGGRFLHQAGEMGLAWPLSLVFGRPASSAASRFRHPAVSPTHSWLQQRKNPLQDPPDGATPPLSPLSCDHHSYRYGVLTGIGTTVCALLKGGLLTQNDARDWLKTLLKQDPDIPAVSLQPARTTLLESEPRCPLPR